MKKTMFSILLIILAFILVMNINPVYAKVTRTKQGTSHNLGEIINEADGFVEKGESGTERIDEASLIDMSNTIYNILLGVSIVIAVILGIILGIKFVTEGVEGQSEVKKALIPYVAGCAIVFGAFTIWKVVVDVLQNL